MTNQPLFQATKSSVQSSESCRGDGFANVSLSSKQNFFYSFKNTLHQGALPRLPIPELNDTLDKYIQSLKALEGNPNVSREDIDRAIGYVNGKYSNFLE